MKMLQKDIRQFKYLNLIDQNNKFFVSLSPTHFLQRIILGVALNFLETCNYLRNDEIFLYEGVILY